MVCRRGCSCGMVRCKTQNLYEAESLDPFGDGFPGGKPGDHRPVRCSPAHFYGVGRILLLGHRAQSGKGNRAAVPAGTRRAAQHHLRPGPCDAGPAVPVPGGGLCALESICRVRYPDVCHLRGGPGCAGAPPLASGGAGGGFCGAAALPVHRLHAQYLCGDHLYQRLCRCAHGAAVWRSPGAVFYQPAQKPGAAGGGMPGGGGLLHHQRDQFCAGPHRRGTGVL